jgi:hypothetical protein
MVGVLRMILLFVKILLVEQNITNNVQIWEYQQHNTTLVNIAGQERIRGNISLAVYPENCHW